MVALRGALAALAFLRPGQLLETAVKLLHLPAHLHGLTTISHVRCAAKWLVMNHSMSPFVATSLKSFTPKGTSLKRSSTPWLQPPGGGSRAWSYALVAAFLGQAHQPVALRLPHACWRAPGASICILFFRVVVVASGGVPSALRGLPCPHGVPSHPARQAHTAPVRARHCFPTRRNWARSFLPGPIVYPAVGLQRSRYYIR